MVGHAAKVILEADRPLIREEIFPQNGEFYGRSLSKTWQQTILDNFVRDGHVTETTTKSGIKRYNVRNELELAYIARACPPTVEDDDEEPMRQGTGYNKQEWTKYARCQVAIRALKRLLASHQSEGKSARFQPKTTLFLAKKGDKFQERQVIDQSWQKLFLSQLEEHGVIRSEDDKGIPVYEVASASLLQGVIDSDGHLPCVHTMLWPNEPCQIDHSQSKEDSSNSSPEEEPEAESESESESDEGPASEETPITEVKEEEPIPPNPPPAEIVSKPGEEKTDEHIISDALNQMLGLQGDIAENLSLQGKHLDVVTRLLTKLSHEVEHLHSKLDKVHDENVHLRTEHETMDNTICEMKESLENLEKAFDPNESSILAIRKRLVELEKLSVEHKASLDSSNKLIKTSLAEAAGSMVSAAAKAFIQADHSTVLTKMQTVEERLVESQSQVNHTLNAVFEALEKVRAEYKNNARTPAIFDRMTAIADELKRLQRLLPDLPAAIHVPSVDLSGV